MATGHQRHYNILYDNAVEMIRQRLLGQLHYIRAQWHRGNLPGNDSWQQPLPPGVKMDDAANVLEKELTDMARTELAEAEKKSTPSEVENAQADHRPEVRRKSKTPGRGRENYGYERVQLKDAAGNVVYDRPPIEELIRWRLWDRTGAGLMAELGSHQLDAASIFIAAAARREETAPLERGGGRQSALVSARPRHRGSRLLHLRVSRPRLRRQGPHG